jgi:hypothetical protein
MSRACVIMVPKERKSNFLNWPQMERKFKLPGEHRFIKPSIGKAFGASASKLLPDILNTSIEK